MVAAFNDMQKVWRFHFDSNPLQKIQRTKRIAGALHKENGRGQSAQDFIAEFCAVAHRAERVSKTDESVHFFGERHVASNTPTHAFAGQYCNGIGVFPLGLSQGSSMRGNELWQRIGPFPALSRVGIIKDL